jgi:hypothetical protein
MEGLRRGTEWGYSLWEFWVFDRADVPLPEPDETGDVTAPADLRPDLIVSKVAWLEDPLLKNDGVTFRAVVENQGNAAVLGGFHCTFWVNNKLVSWSETTYPLSPGTEMPLIANGGPDGNALWEPNDTGPFIVRAWVDAPEGEAPDSGIGRVDESDEHNNMQTDSGYVLLKPFPPTATLIPRPTQTASPTATPQPIVAEVTATPEPVSQPLATRTVVLIGGAGVLVVIAALAGIVLRRRRG